MSKFQPYLYNIIGDGTKMTQTAIQRSLFLSFTKWMYLILIFNNNTWRCVGQQSSFLDLFNNKNKKTRMFTVLSRRHCYEETVQGRLRHNMSFRDENCVGQQWKLPKETVRWRYRCQSDWFCERKTQHAYKCPINN